MEQARHLLTEALKKENDAEIKNEIERRLVLLDSKAKTQTKCRSCGKVFDTNQTKRYPTYLCMHAGTKRKKEPANTLG